MPLQRANQKVTRSRPCLPHLFEPMSGEPAAGARKFLILAYQRGEEFPSAFIRAPQSAQADSQSWETNWWRAWEATSAVEFSF